MNDDATPNPVSPRCSRRRLLQIGGLGYCGLSLPGFLQSRALASPRTATNSASVQPIEACILVFFYGGPSHLDTWDMKPNAPSDVRGEFKAVATRVPGVHVCEYLPRLATVMNHVALIRSMHHPMRNHNAAAVEALCGRTPLGGDQELLADDALAFPCYGSLVHYLRRHEPRDLSHVALPHVMYNVVQLPGQTAGFLGPRYNPFHVEADPTVEHFQVPELQLPADMTLQRLEHRQSLVDTIDAQLAQADQIRPAAAMQAYYEQAYTLLRSATVRNSFDLAQEPPTVRERYGRNVLGQSALLARRLVESGVPFVTVYDKVRNGQEANWDSHAQNFARHRDHLLPPADRALSTLIADLDERGLLASTLVVALGEFGRTPRINAAAGRDHWPDCFTVLLAGGGVQGGAVYGASDKLGAYPDSDPVTPGDLAATLLWRFGLDPRTELRDLNDRPYHAADGSPLTALFT